MNTERYHGLDLLRGFAMMLGLLIHATAGYEPDGADSIGLSTVEAQPIDDWIYMIMGWIHQWRMPLFFMLAGFFGCMIVERQGAFAYLKDRLVRIGLALVVFATIFNLLFPPFDFRLDHLWFLYYLMGVCAVAAGVAWVVTRVEVAARFARALSWPAKRLVTLALYLVPIIAFTPFARIQGWAIVPEVFGEFQLLPFLYYCLWFGIGAALYWHRTVLNSLKHWGMIAASFVVAILAMLAGFDALFASEEFDGAWYDWAIFSAISTAAWCLFFIGLCLRLLKNRNSVVKWFVELSYPIYILHMYPSYILGAIFLSLGWSAGQAFWPIVLGSFFISVALYYLLIKFTPLDWLLAGPRKAWFRPHWLGLTTRA